jgi:hypothetical protein
VWFWVFCCRSREERSRVDVGHFFVSECLGCDLLDCGGVDVKFPSRLVWGCSGTRRVSKS